ncbi:hypothetical protein [Actinomyces oris]|uniref:hypothetical protein n=1 Tax=Actinomyces oris TaxID=544580 RepID=UPI000A714671|nr:hypothetical protein [Actinomyces oris]
MCVGQLGLWCLLAGVVAIEGQGCVASRFTSRNSGTTGMSCRKAFERCVRNLRALLDAWFPKGGA